MLWPKTFPGNCPPDDTKQRTITGYILVSEPIVPDDFLSLRQRHPESTFLNPEVECQAHGISVFEKVEHLQRVQRRVKRLRNRHIGVCHITPDMGVLKPTRSQFGNSHRTWWIPVSITPWKHTKKLSQEDEEKE